MKTNTTPTPNMQARVPPGSGTDELSKFWDAARSNQFGTFVRKRPIYERLVALDAGHPNRGQRMTCSAYGDLATLPYHETNALNTQRRPFHLHGNHPRQNLRHGSSTSRTSTFRSSSARALFHRPADATCQFGGAACASRGVFRARPCRSRRADGLPILMSHK